MAETPSVVTCKQMLETQDKLITGLAADQKRIFTTYRDYVVKRMATTDIWSNEFKSKRGTVVYTVNEIKPSLFEGMTAYLGTAVDHTGGEVDVPPLRFDQTAFLVAPSGTWFLNFFKRQSDDDGTLRYTDVPFCSQKYLIAVGRSVMFRISPREHEHAQKEAKRLTQTDLRSMLPELRGRLHFEAGLNPDNASRLKEMTEFLFFLLFEHDSGGFYLKSLHSKLAWTDGKTPLPNPTQWSMARGFDLKSMFPYSTRAWKDGLEAEGFVVLDENTLVHIHLAISPTEFLFTSKRLGQIRYGP